MKTCCERAKEMNVIRWNPDNEVVQCHSCGNVYTAASRAKYLFNRVFKWWGY